MNNNLSDILYNSNKDIDNQQLMDYLSHHLSAADNHAVEKEMINDAFVNDAVEGLEQIQTKKNLHLYVEQLNSGLQQQITKNKKRKEKRRLKDQPYTYFAIILILLLLVICFIVFKRYSHVKPAADKTVIAFRSYFLLPRR